jgi:AcrR family transcriptional regulator
MRSALELIGEQGVEKTSLAQIGERAGFSRGLVNHHFGTKAALLERLVTEAQLVFTDSLPPDDDLLGLDALLMIARVYIGQIAEPEPISRSLPVLWAAAVSARSDLGLRPIFCEADRLARSLLSSLVARGIADGSIRPDANPEVVAAGVFGQLRGLGVQRVIDQTLALDQMIEPFVELLRVSLAARTPCVGDTSVVHP